MVSDSDPDFFDGFEGGTFDPRWEVASGTPTVQKDVVHSGEYAAYLDGTDGEGDRLILDFERAMEVGDSLSVWIYVEDSGPGNCPRIRIAEVDDSGTQVSRLDNQFAARGNLRIGGGGDFPWYNYGSYHDQQWYEVVFTKKEGGVGEFVVKTESGEEIASVEEGASSAEKFNRLTLITRINDRNYASAYFDNIAIYRDGTTDSGTGTFEVKEYVLSTAELDPGEQFSIQTTVENTGQVAQEQVVAVSLADETIATRSIKLGPGEAITTGFEVEAPVEEGSYTYTVATNDDEATGEIDVVDPRDTDGKEIDTPPTDSDLKSRLRDATTVATVTIDSNDYRVLQEIPGESSDRFAYTDDQYRLLEPNAAANVAISYTYCDTYGFTNERRLEYTTEQYEEFGSLERMARAADLLSDLSGAIALAKISPISTASNAVAALQTVVEWGEHELTDPYHEQFAKMAAVSSTVDWADERLPRPGGALVNPAHDVLEVTQTMLGAAEAVDAVEDLAESASTVREIVRQADSIRDNVSPEAVDGADDLAPTAFTLFFGLAVDTTVDSVSGVAEGQARAAAIGKGQAAVRRPLLNELIELEERARNYDLGPAGVLRMQTLHQTDYQIEAAALYGQASVIENYQSSRLGSIVAAFNGTEELPSSLRSLAETYRDLSHFQFAAIGELFEQALENHRDSLNANEYGDQDLFNQP